MPTERQVMKSPRFWRRSLRCRRVRPLRLEPLEARWVLSGQAVLAGDVFNLRENGPQTTLNVLANDTFDADYIGQRLVTAVSFGSEGGRIELAADRKSVLYTPPADFSGSESFVYVVDGQYTAGVQVNIQSPLADDKYTIPPDGVERTLDVLANDPFWPGYVGAKKITSVSVGSEGGTIAIGADGKSIRYTAPDEAFGRETFIYVVDDIYPAQVTIDIPIALKEDNYEFVQHAPPATMTVLTNDPFWAGYNGEKKITAVTASQHGATIEIAADGKSLHYTQPADFGDWATSYQVYDSFRYIVDSAHEAYVTVVLHRPVRDDWFEVDQNSTAFFYDVTQNDSYYDLRNQLRDVVQIVTSVTQPESGGTVAISADGRGIVYTPPAGFAGSDKFTYMADGKHEAIVNVQVTRPVRDDYLSTGIYQDTPGATLFVLSNDFVGNGYSGPRVITGVGATEYGGTVAIRNDGKALLYTPALGFTGTDQFTYRVDGALEAGVTVYVQALAQPDHFEFCPNPNDPPYAIHVLGNDFFNRGYAGPGVITAVEVVAGSGQVTIQNGRALLFDPGAAGWHSIKYTVDGKYETTASVSIRNLPDPDQVLMDQNAAAVRIDVLTNDFDPEPYYSYYHCPAQNYPGPRQITSVSATKYGGVVTIAPDGRSLYYQPPADFHGEDSFTYTVDGFMTGTVTAQVIRRVRDDQYRVDAADGPQSLPVLVNDLFGANYAGPGQITGVTATSAGGTATIAADGHAIVYTPRAGFVGSDTFTYTVDGKLKAQVTVVVDVPAVNQQGTFGSLTDYMQFLIEDALERYQHLFGQPAWTFVAFDDLDGPTMAGPRGPAERNHSETNVQVAGVDEGDIVEFDADYVYMLTDSDVVIVDAWPADELAIASRVDIEGRPIAEFLHGDRLTVISETGGFFGLPIDVLPATVDFIGRPIGDSIWTWPPFPVEPYSTIVTVIDVSDRSEPTIVQTTTMEGKYVDSRGVGDYVYALVSNADAVAPQPEVVDDDNDPQTLGRYETREEFVARVIANTGKFVEAALPNYTAYGPDGEMVRTGLLNMPEDIFRPLVPDAFNLISVVSFNVEGNEPGLADTSGVYSTGASAIYASLDNFYVFDADYSAEDGALTRIVKFDWEPADGSIDFAATTTVAGSIINQFSADESGEFLRIATTAHNSYSGNWSGRDENMLFVLREDGGVMEFVGSLQNLALDETIRSVRFMGERAFITTFRTIDPLFAIDMSDPVSPNAIGHITLPGFSSYMHLIDENHLLTVGQNTPGTFGGPTQVSLFDISNMAQPLRIAEYTFTRFSTSEAQLDHHAFGYYAEHGLLGMPVARVFYERVDEDGDGYRETRRAVTENLLAVFSVDVAAANAAERLVLETEILHGTPVRRSGYIGDKLYSIANDSVKVVDVNALDTLIDELLIPALEPEPLPDPVPVPILDQPLLYSGTSLLAQTTNLPATRTDGSMLAGVVAARADLAARLQMAGGAPLLVSTEAAPDAPGGGYDLVFRIGNTHYLYRAGVTGNVQLVDAQFEFGAADGAWHATQSSYTATLPGMAGDYNGDDRVDEADRAVWRASFGSWSLTESLPADGNRNGVVDTADFAVWRANLGRIAGDFDGSGVVDDADRNIWQAAFGSTSDLRADANRNGQVDTADFAVWRRARNATAASQALDELLLYGDSFTGNIVAADDVHSVGTASAYSASEASISMDQNLTDFLVAIDAAFETAFA